MWITRRLFVILSTAAIPLLSSCGPDPTGLSDEPAEDIVLYGVHQNLTADGKLVARIQADSVYHREASPAMLFWAPAIDFSPTYPQSPPFLSGDQVVINHALKRLILRGNAVFRFPAGGFSITTQEIRFGYSKGWLVADSPSIAFPPTSFGGIQPPS